MASTEVHLQDGHVGDGADDVEDEEDGAYWYVDVDGWATAEGGGCGRIWARSWEVGFAHCGYPVVCVRLEAYCLGTGGVQRAADG